MKLIDLRGLSEKEAIATPLPRPAVDTTRAVDLVRPILDRVKHEGAPALYELASEFDGVRPSTLRVPKERLEQSLESLDPKLREALEIAIEHARLAHSAQMPMPAVTEVVPGGSVTQRWVPLRRVGLYVPGGLAVYPSSVVMNVVTAQVAGVDEIVVASPPQKAAGGYPDPTILAACALLGVDEVIAAGGAQAIGALAYGFTDDLEESYACAPVDKVAGPGNIYVAAAKRVVQEVCGIDAEAGTTEIAILADGRANPAYVAADLISQAEHDPAAASVLVTDSADLVQQVQDSLLSQVEMAQHSERIREALGGPQSAIVLVDSLNIGEAVIEAYAPEHLEVITRDERDRAMRIRNAGAIFVGEHSPVPLGDYLAGSNHVLPTGGTARYASGLNATQYLRSVQVVEYDAAALSGLAEPLSVLAEAEGLPAHAAAVKIRRTGDDAARVPRAQEVRLPLRPDLSGVEPYGAPQLEVPVRLNVNENPYAPSAEVVDSVTAAVRQAMGQLNRYADRDATKLREDLAEYLRIESAANVTADQVWAANGSNEVMLQLLEAFGGPGRTVLAAAPTYSMYEEYARDTTTGWQLLPPAVGGGIPQPDIGAMKDALRRYRPSVLMLPNPNNPTGQMLDQTTLVELLEIASETGPIIDGQPTSTLVVVDEAYAEFRPVGEPSALKLLGDHKNLIVTRTMSKAFAAAGLRLGYLIASPQVVYEINKVRLPYHLSLLTQAAARAVLKHTDQQLAQVDQIREERDRLRDWLTQNGYQVSRSYANFLLFGPVRDRETVWADMVKRGVLIRVVGPDGYLRVTVGTPEENRQFQEALQEATK